MLSVVSNRRTLNVQRRVAAIEEDRRSEELEQRGRANVTARLRYSQSFDPNHEKYYDLDSMEVLNRGPAIARDVMVTLRPVEGAERAPELRDTDFPVSVLDAGGIYSVPLNYHGAYTCLATLSWRDEHGTSKREITLRAPS